MAIVDERPEGGRRTRAARRPVLVGLIALGVVAGLVFAGLSFVGHTSAALDALPQGPYVALGDSYTAGIDIPGQVGTPAGCGRSNHDYPTLVASYLKLSANQFHDASCNGATIADLFAPQPAGSGSNPAQLSALSAATRLVTVGIGGNDLDFAGVLTRCVELDAPGTVLDLVLHLTDSGSRCRAFYTANGADAIQQKIQTASTKFAAALARISQLAPHARVYVIGYPDLLPASGSAATACADVLGMTPDDVSFLNGEELRLNSMLQQRAAAAGDAYVGTYAPSRGFDACSDPATRWIEPLFPSAAAAPMHPNELGERGMANIVEHTLAPAG